MVKLGEGLLHIRRSSMRKIRESVTSPSCTAGIQRLLFYVRAQFAREKNQKKTRIKRKPPMIRSMIMIHTRQDPNRKSLAFLNEDAGSHHID